MIMAMRNKGGSGRRIDRRLHRMPSTPKRKFQYFATGKDRLAFAPALGCGLRRPRPGAVLTHTLPHIGIAKLAGLLEHLAALPDGRSNIYRLAQDLHCDSDHLLQMIERGGAFGIRHRRRRRHDPDALGETLVQASIQMRKESFTARIRRLPMFR